MTDYQLERLCRKISDAAKRLAILLWSMLLMLLLLIVVVLAK